MRPAVTVLNSSKISVGDVVIFTGLAQSTVSQHLAVLEKANLIRMEKRELWSCYFLNDEILEQFLEQMKKTCYSEYRVNKSYSILAFKGIEFDYI